MCALLVTALALISQCSVDYLHSKLLPSDFCLSKFLVTLLASKFHLTEEFSRKRMLGRLQDNDGNGLLQVVGFYSDMTTR